MVISSCLLLLLGLLLLCVGTDAHMPLSTSPVCRRDNLFPGLVASIKTPQFYTVGKPFDVVVEINTSGPDRLLYVQGLSETGDVASSVWLTEERCMRCDRSRDTTILSSGRPRAVLQWVARENGGEITFVVWEHNRQYALSEPVQLISARHKRDVEDGAGNSTSTDDPFTTMYTDSYTTEEPIKTGDPAISWETLFYLATIVGAYIGMYFMFSLLLLV